VSAAGCHRNLQRGNSLEQYLPIGDMVACLKMKEAADRP